MGRAKQEWIESQERGWAAPEKHACAECIGDDPFLKLLVAAKATATTCDYCGDSADDPIAAPVEELMPAIAHGLFSNFAEPAEAGLPYSDGEYVGSGSITDTEDALLSLPFNCGDGTLFEEIVGAFHNTDWYPCSGGHWLDTPLHEDLRYSWEHFVNVVKHQSRFFFTSEPKKKQEHGDPSGPLNLLHQIAELAQALDLIVEVASKTDLFRVRKTREKDEFSTFEQLGPPPLELATAGRMNPAGISYLYLAFEKQTAFAEVLDRPPTRGTLGSFQTQVPVVALDLTKIPLVPSVFDESQSHEREIILFLRGFVNAITQSTLRDGREHIDYVPSQVVSEFFAQVFRTPKGQMLDALIYPSAVMPGGRNIVFFPSRDYKRPLERIVKLVERRLVLVPNWKIFEKLLHEK